MQVCTGVMLHGYGLVKPLCEELKGFMRRHGFKTIQDFKGYAISMHSLDCDTGNTDTIVLSIVEYKLQEFMWRGGFKTT